MGILSWLRRPGLPSSRPDPSSAGRRTASRRPASPSDSFEPSPARAGADSRAAAGARPAVRRLGHGLAAVLLPALLALPLLLGLADGAQAQSNPIVIDVEVDDAYEGEDIKVVLKLSRAPGSIAAGLRTLSVSTANPSSAHVTGCIGRSFPNRCDAGSMPASSASDYTAQSNTSVVFGPNDTVKTVLIATATDNVSEGTEIVQINIEYTGGSSSHPFRGVHSGRNHFGNPALIFPTYVLINSFGQIRNGARPGPAKPTGLTATPGDGQVTLSWNNPGDSSITKWQSRYTTATTQNNWVDISPSTATTTSHTITGLSNGLEHTFQIRAVSAAGDGASSDRVTATPTAPKPAKPTGFEAAPGNGQVTLSWDNPSDSSISRWEARWKTSGNYNNWSQITGSGPTTTTFTLQGLTNGTAYTFQIRAVNANGNGAESDEVTATPGAPSKPTGLTATPGNRQVMLSWTNPNDSSITGWQGRYKAGSGIFGIWNNISGSTATTTSTTYTSLPNGTEHTFQVRAVNAHGNGAPSDEVTATPTADSTAPTVSSIVRHSPSTELTNTRTLTWRVTFDEAVRNVDAADFGVRLASPDGFSSPTITVTGVSRHGSTNAYDVTVTIGSGTTSGEFPLYLIFVSTHNIQDTAGNALAASPAAPSTNENSFDVDLDPPEVDSITRQSPSSSPTDADSLTWRVTFDDRSPIRNVDAADFTVTGTGTGTTATVTGVSQVQDDEGQGTNAYDVTVSGGNLAGFEGTVTLGFASNHNIQDEAGNPLPASPVIRQGNTNDNTFVIENIDPQAPRVQSIVRHAPASATAVNATSLTWRVTFTKPLAHVYYSDFRLAYGGWTPSEDDGARILLNHVKRSRAGTTELLVQAHRSDFDFKYANGTVTLELAPDHGARDGDGRQLPNLDPVGGGADERVFTLDGSTTTIAFTHAAYRVWEGEKAVVALRLSKPLKTATAVTVSATALTATGNGVDYTGQSWTVTIPAAWETASFVIPTTKDTNDEGDEVFRLDIHDFALPAGVTEAAPPGATNTDARVTISDPPAGGTEGGVVADAAARAACVPAGLAATAERYWRWNRHRGPDHGIDWFRVLVAFGERTPDQWTATSVHTATPATSAFAREEEKVWSGWTPFAEALECIEAEMSKGVGAPPVEVPTAAVTNLQVTATDATSAGVTWDAVEHATSYDVSWDLAGDDGTSAGGGSERVAGTSATIRHDATAAMTLTVRVTPEHLDGNGETQRLDALAVTAELAVGPGTTEAGAGQGADAPGDGSQGHEADVANGSVTVDVPADWTGRGRPQVTGGAHRLSGWSGLGFDFQGLGSPPGTLTVSWSSRPAGAVKLPLEWQPVAGADWRHSDGGPVGKFEVDIIDPLPEQPEQPQQPTPTPIPEVTVSGGGGVTEGASASFTLTVDPAPGSPVEVTLSVSQDGDFAASGETGARTVTVPTTGSVSVDIPTVDDGRDEPDGSITLTVDSCDGCTVGAASTHTVSVADNDVAPALPELSLAAGAAVDEGTAAGFTITANPAPQADIAIAYTVAQAGDVLAAPGAGSRTVTLAAGKTSVAVPVATDDDAVNEPDGAVTVTLNAGTGYTVAAGAGSGSVTVRDDDVPVVGVTAGSGVTEGTAASFTVTANPTPHAALDVALTVTQDGDFAASGETGARTVTVPTTGSVTVEVPTDNDTADEPDGSVTATVGAGTGYAVAAAPGNAATVEVADDDAAAGVPTVSVADVSGKESDRFLWFTVRLSRPSDRHVTVYLKTRDSTPVSAEALRDYIPYRNRTEYFRPGETEKRVPVYVFDDSHDEDPETFELVLTDVWTTGRAQGGVTIADGVAVGTIVNSDPMPAAWLARFGRTAAEQALDGIAGRMAAPRTAGVQGAIAGQAVNFDPGSGSSGGGAANDPGSLSGAGALPGGSSDNGLSMAQSNIARAFGAGNGGFGSGPGQAFGSGHDSFGFGTDSSGPQSRSMTAREALLGSSFTATGEKDGSGGTMAFWGRAAQSSFDGREGTFSLDGEATTAMLGADYARDRWLVGLALMQTGGEGGYADTGTGPQSCPEGIEPEMAHLCNGAVREGDGKVEASLTAAIPYGAWQASERLKLWGAAGYGTGEVTLKPEPGGSYRADIAWTMAAAGLRGDVIAPPAEGSGPALAVTSDALWARTSSDKTHDLAASESDVTRLRIGLEGSYRVALEEGGSVTPKLEVGARHDGGDAETGFGVELGGGLAWNDPALGLTLDLSGRTLIAHGNDDLKDRGYSASLAWDPDPATERGPSLSLTQDWGGQAKGGLDALFTPETIDRRSGGGEPTARWQAEAAYGFPAFGDRFTGSPHVGLGLATGSRDYSLGWRLTPTVRSPDLSFGLKATRRENDGTVPEHTVGFEVQARW